VVDPALPRAHNASYPLTKCAERTAIADDDFVVIFPQDGAVAQRRLGDLLPVRFRFGA
jgi:cytidine deaminase